MRTPKAIVLGGLALGLLAACGGMAVPSLPVFPSQSAAALRQASPAPAATATPVVVASPSATPAPSKAKAPASQPAPSQQPALPKELLIPAIHVDAPVEQLGITPDGTMEAPREWNDVGWFDQGYRPGTPGSAVIAGHLDSTTDKAVFWDLHLLKVGDKLQLKTESGGQLTFQVMGSQAYPFDQAPLQRIFGPATESLLNLVTCDGTWNNSTKNYNQRLVVYTREIPG